MTLNHSIVRLGLIQLKSELQPKANLSKTLDAMATAVRQGAQIICLQELFLSPYFCQTNDEKYFELAHTLPNEHTEALAKFAKENAVVVVGSFFEKTLHPAGKTNYFNTATIWNTDGHLLGKYRKLHIPDDLPNYYSEKFYFADGDLDLPVFETAYGKVGLQVCWDQWFPEGARALALKGAEFIFYPTAIGWPSRQEPYLNQKEFAAWVTVQRGHAIANTVFVAATNRTGIEDNLNFWGGSFVSDPFGEILSQASTDQEEILVVPCDKSRITECRQDWPFLKARRPEVYR